MTLDNIGSHHTSTDYPVVSAARYETLDVLRGLAVLAIFAVNIKGMTMPFAWYFNASLWTAPYDMGVATLQAFIIDDKWRTIFTALFGAGTVLIAEKAAARNTSPLHRLSRRNFWLLMFGLAHMLLIWIGDILTSYAITGFVAMAFWRMSVKTLWRWALGLFILGYIWIGILNMSMAYIPEVREEVIPIMWLPDTESLSKTSSVFLSDNIFAHIALRAEESIFILSSIFIGGLLPLTLSIMLAGMALWKNGFLKGELNTATYMRIALWGLGLAVLTDVVRWGALIASSWRFEIFMLSQFTNVFNGFAGGLGFAALIMAWVKSGSGPRFLSHALKATGRMAFTNYITCSLVGTSIALGHAGRQFGALGNLELMGIVVTTWIALLLFSSVWLSAFRFGPLEWLWRSLSYGKMQTIVKETM